ncbi:SPARC-related modular calcium-binding protein 1 isoform X5 [Girardinichthys multiradiatus]|uniref:SPARC-related modular calcium-binding protein 1 isoform X5 n=1 Tax=Girardinichthys multiradiatus TaxID=208333 RepID=UPI001FADFD6D|nr:SPARC-related modular calcium-binding protein 1 isoform X5 [Girardinichthys multiradiatus]
MLLPGAIVFTFSCFLAPLFLFYLPQVSAQKPGSRWLIGERDSHCGTICSRTLGKQVCGSDGRTYETNCELQRARCKDKTLTMAHRGRCRVKFPFPVGLSPTSSTEGRDPESKDAGQSKCHVERNQALEQARRPQESTFIPECNEDGTFAQVQCHTLTGYCWCATTDGKPVSGSSVHNRRPVCSGNFSENMGTHAGRSGFSVRSVTDKPPGPPNTGRKGMLQMLRNCTRDDGSKPTPTMETHITSEGEGITAPTLWRKHLGYMENKQNSSTFRRQEKVPSCDQERQNALNEAQQSSREAIIIPDCGSGGLYKPVQCHQYTGYCWCVLVDTGRPIPGTSTLYKTPECDEDARSHTADVEDPFHDRPLQGCPDGKKGEFITSLLDALTTDMVQAINSPAPSGGGRFVEPDPNHTLEERVVNWYFAQLDNNGSNDINKKELKPFKRYLKKKAKPKKCARKFTDYCDLNKDKAISLQELKGCLGVSKDGSSMTSGSQGTRQGTKHRPSGVKRKGTG